jgi:hypothetical protein
LALTAAFTGSAGKFLYLNAPWQHGGTQSDTGDNANSGDYLAFSYE